MIRRVRTGPDNCRDARIKGLDPSAPLSVCTAQFCSRASFERRSIKHARDGGGYSSSILEILAIYNHSKGSAIARYVQVTEVSPMSLFRVPQIWRSKDLDYLQVEHL